MRDQISAKMVNIVTCRTSDHYTFSQVKVVDNPL